MRKVSYGSILNVAMFQAIAPPTFALIALAASVMTSCGSIREGNRGLATVAQTQTPTVAIKRDCDRPSSSYVAACVSTGARPDTPIRDVPHSAQVIPRPVIDDQKAVRLYDASTM